MTEPRDELKELLEQAKTLLRDRDELTRLLGEAGIASAATALANLVLDDYSQGVKAHALAKSVLAQAAFDHKRACLDAQALGVAHGREVRLTEEIAELRGLLEAVNFSADLLRENAREAAAGRDEQEIEHDKIVGELVAAAAKRERSLTIKLAMAHAREDRRDEILDAIVSVIEGWKGGA